jgi:hypothetical protein
VSVVRIGTIVGSGGALGVAKVKITTWVDESTAGVLRGLAAQGGVSVSEFCAQKLRLAVEEDAAGGIGAEMLVPAVRTAVRREVERMSDRLAHLLVRSALESAAARRVVLQVLVGELGREEALAVNDAAWTGSVESLKRPARGLREILGEGAEADGAEGSGRAG